MISKTKKLTRVEARAKIYSFFKFIKNKSPQDIKRIKKLAASFNIRLGRLRRKFYQDCYTPFTSKTAEIRIKNKKKIIKCKVCGKISRFKLS